MVDFPRISDDLIQQLRGIFFAKDRSPILSSNNWIGVPLLESTPTILPSVSNYYFYFKTGGGLYRLDWDGNEVQVNGLDSLPVHTHADNNQGGVIPLDNTTVSKLRQSDDGGDALSADASGYLSSVSQPLFSAYNSVTDTNVTGDGTFYTVIFDTEVFDVDGNYNNATGIFTAPVTGKYLLIESVLLDDLDTDTYEFIALLLTTSNRTYIATVVNPETTRVSISGLMQISTVTVIADMDVNDTAKVEIQVGTGTKTVDVFGQTNMRTFFQGYLLI